MRKICALTANRADFSRIETILEAVNEHPNLELQLVVFGSHLLEKTGRTIEEIERKGFRVNYKIYMEMAGSNPTTMAKSVGLAIVELSTALDQLKPDVVIAPVDRFESMAMGVARALMNIHVAHIQGGEVTGTIDESIRHALTKISHLHFVATEKSRERVIRMGEPENTVFNVGCPGTDLLLRVPKLDARSTVERLNREVIKGSKKLNTEEPFALMIQHPVTTEYGSAAKQIAETMEALVNFPTQVIVLWPNIDAGSDEISKVLRGYERRSLGNGNHFIILKHIPTDLFVNILRNSLFQIGNSSSGIREACYFGLPVINIGTRQSGRERGRNVIDVWYDRNRIEEAIRRQLSYGRYPVEQIYGDGTAGKKISEILASIELPDIQKRITY